MSEKETLVTNINQLQIGKLIKVKSCLQCGNTHRWLITGKTKEWSEMLDQVIVIFWGNPCKKAKITNRCHLHFAIQDKRVSIIDTNLDNQEENPYKIKRKISV